MAFIGYDFLIFFFIVFVLYWLFPHRRWQNVLLLFASLLFYGWLAAWHSAILFASILADYFLALGMARWKSKSAFLMWVGIVLNLALLASVKYYPIYAGALAGYAGGFFSSMLLPLGVSFYVLKKIAYLADVQRGSMQPTSDLIAFAAYVSFFPQVFSGPIDRPQAFLKQLEARRVWKAGHFHNAWMLLTMGLFKKIVVANAVKVIVDQVFLMKEPSKAFLIVGGLGFTLQILADFSSYTDLSRGFAFLLGLQTTENFNQPYLALTPNDFWNRWHISFSSWLRDYIFFPLRRRLLRIKKMPGIAAQVVPPLAAMFVSGLWHGAGLTFVVWGLYYGVLIVVYHSLGIRGDSQSVVKRFFSWLVMFAFIVFGWILFRSSSIFWFWNALTATPFSHGSNELIASFVLLAMIAFHAALLYIKYLLDVFAPERIALHAAYSVFALALTVVYINSSSPDFIYFQF